MKTIAHNDSDMRPIVIDLSVIYTIEKQVPQKDRSNAMALYCFYYKHSILQATQSVWCENRMVVGLNSDGSKNEKGFGWCGEKIARIRKLLQDCGLIKIIRKRGMDGKFRKKTYVVIRWYKGKDSVEKAEYRAMIAQRDELISEMRQLIKDMRRSAQSGKNRDSVKHPTQSGKNPGQVKTSVNACSPSETLNACSPKGTVAHTKRMGRQSTKSFNLHAGKHIDSPGYRLAKKLFQAVRKRAEERGPNQLPKKDRVTGKRDWRKWEEVFTQFLRNGKHTEQAVSQVIEWYAQNIDKDYTPKVYAANTFCSKYGAILDAVDREEADRRKKNKRKNLDPDGHPYPTDNGMDVTFTDKNGWEVVRHQDGTETHTSPDGSEMFGTWWGSPRDQGSNDFDSEVR